MFMLAGDVRVAADFDNTEDLQLSWLARLQALPKDSSVRTLAVALVVSLCSAVLVAGVAIQLRPQYLANQELNRQRNIVAVAGLEAPGAGVAELFAQIEARVVNLETGEYAPGVDPDELIGARAAAARDPGVPVPVDLDVALIKRRPAHAVVYLIQDADQLSGIVLPVYGYGLWSTMYGYIALEADANTVIGLRFYEHGETPGLGAQIDNPGWQALWQGKKIYGESGTPQIEVVKGQSVPGTARAVHQVDGITGATLTGDGVTNLLRYWLGDQGFGPYLRRIREAREETL